MTMPTIRRAAVLITGLMLAAAPHAAPAAQAPVRPTLYTATDAITRVVAQRVGGDAEVTVVSLDVKGDAAAFREARPDPSATLGKPIRFTLFLADGSSLAATALVTVVVSHAVVRQALARGQVVADADVEAVLGELTGTPLARVPARSQIVGTRTLRPMAVGAVVLPSSVAIRRTVEPGDPVTVVALAGAIEVTATFVAADGGNVGDTIRVRNPDSKQYVRGRIVKAGLVEVNYER